MCTAHCPCYVTEMGVSPFDPDQQAMARYNQVNEPYLNLRNRTWNESTKAESDGRDRENYQPLVWTTDSSKGVKTFEECIGSHFKDGMSGDEITEKAILFMIQPDDIWMVNEFLQRRVVPLDPDMD